MNKKNEKKKLDEQELLEKEFHKTKLGKFMRLIEILAVLAIIIGVIIVIFEAIVYAKDLDINKYQTIISIGEKSIKCGGKSILFGMLFYGCVLPAKIENNKEDKTTKKGKSDSTKLILVIFTICMVAPILQLLFEILALIS